MREPYIPLTFSEKDYNSRFCYEKDGYEKLWAYKKIDESILKTYKTLIYIRNSYKWDAKDKTEGNKNVASTRMISIDEVIDENSEQKYKDKLEGFFEINEQLKAYRDSVFLQLNSSPLNLYMVQKSIPDCALELGLSIEEFVIQFLYDKKRAEKIAYWDYVEKHEDLTRKAYEILKNGGFVEEKTIEEFYLHLTSSCKNYTTSIGGSNSRVN